MLKLTCRVGEVLERGYGVLLPGKRHADGTVHKVEFPWVWFGPMAASQGFHYRGEIRLWLDDFMRIWRAVD